MTNCPAKMAPRKPAAISTGNHAASIIASRFFFEVSLLIKSSTPFVAQGRSVPGSAAHFCRTKQTALLLMPGEGGSTIETGAIF